MHTILWLMTVELIWALSNISVYFLIAAWIQKPLLLSSSMVSPECLCKVLAPSLAVCRQCCQFCNASQYGEIWPSRFGVIWTHPSFHVSTAQTYWYCLLPFVWDLRLQEIIQCTSSGYMDRRTGHLDEICSTWGGRAWGYAYAPPSASLDILQKFLLHETWMQVNIPRKNRTFYDFWHYLSIHAKTTQHFSCNVRPLILHS